MTDHFKTDAIQLGAKLLHAFDAEPMVLRVTTRTQVNEPDKHAYLDDGSESILPQGFSCYLVKGKDVKPNQAPSQGFPPTLALPEAIAHLNEGDIVRINPRRAELWVMYRYASKHNTMLLTERCNSWCVMCSQPPKDIDDSYLAASWLRAIPLMDPSTLEVGISGGEPTLLGESIFSILEACKVHLPNTAVHMLSNGRMFNYLTFVKRLSEVMPRDFMVGVPLYSDLACEHDYVVQASGAFDQTVRGLMNLARLNVPIELRVVIHSRTVMRLEALSEFICRNLPFVNHVALMGLEPIGFGKTNLKALWVDPIDYQVELEKSAKVLQCHGVTASIYNHPLCLLPESLWSIARKSISDWKNIFLDECKACRYLEQCGGLFHSAKLAHSRGIKAF